MSIARNIILLLVVCFVFVQSAVIPDPCYESFNNGDLTTGFYVTGDPGFPSPYACTPSPLNVALSGGEYTLSVTALGGCAQMISVPAVSYGYYECAMQVSGASGTVTTCQVASSTKANYESVYVKFIGNETKRAYTGYYSNGNSYPTGPVDLGFDASGKVHKYGFEWTGGYIRWYIDGNEVTSAGGGKALPQTPNHFYVSMMIENPKVRTDDTLIPTNNVNRTFLPDLTTSLSAVFTNISYTPILYVSCDPTSGIIPGGNAFKSFDPSDCDTRDRFVIYDDKLTKGWSSNLSTTYKLDSTSPLRTGTAAIGWYALPFQVGASFYLVSDKTFNSADYYSLNFWINGGNEGKSGQQIGVKMLFGETATPSVVQISLNEVLDQGIKAGEWSRVVLPFSLWGLNANISEAVKGFVLYTTSNEYGGYLGIDEVNLAYELPMCANKTKNIFADKMAKGVTDLSYGNYKLNDTALPHAGTTAIKYGMYGASGINLKTFEVSSRDYQGIAFWINSRDVTGDKWTVSVTSPNGDSAKNNRLGLPLNLYLYYGGPLPQQEDQWTRVVLPFYEFGIKNTTASKVNGIMFESGSSEYQGILYIDEIDYIRQEKPVKKSSATALSAGFVGIFVMLAVLLL